MYSANVAIDKACEPLTFLCGKKCVTLRFLVFILVMMTGRGELHVGEVELGLRVFKIILLFGITLTLTSSLVDWGFGGAIDGSVEGGTITASQIVQRISQW